MATYSLKTIWLLPVFVLGFCLGSIAFSQGRSAVREIVPHVDLTQPIRVYSSDNSFKMVLTPHCYQANGKSVMINSGRREDVYYVNFGDDILVSCTKIKE